VPIASPAAPVSARGPTDGDAVFFTSESCGLVSSVVDQPPGIDLLLFLRLTFKVH